MTLNKKLFILIIFFSLIFPSNISFADDQNEALFDMLQTGGKALQQKQVNNLKRYNYWWNSLTSRQKQIAYSIDKIEENFKYNNDGMPIIKNYTNINAISNILGVRSPYDRAIVEERMQQHMNEYDDAQSLEQLNNGYEKLKKRIQDSSKPENK